MRPIKHLPLSALAVAAAVLVAPAAAAPRHATLTIRHQVHGCHAWSLDGAAYKASVAVTLARTATLTVVDNDVMPHMLVQVSGPKARLAHSAMGHMPTMTMSHMSAPVTISFASVGVYRFTTKAGEDYKWAGSPKTIGEDNVLRLTVTVR